MKNSKTIRVKAWMIVQKPGGSRKWVPCPTLNPWIFTTKRLAKQKLKEEKLPEFERIMPCVITY